jgi:DNA-binding beta-propeller fold protein YncE
VTATIPVGNKPNNIAVNPVTDKAYVTNLSDNTVSVIDGKTNSVIDIK